MAAPPPPLAADDPPPPPSTTDAALVVDGVITHWSKDDDRALLRACLVAARGAPAAAQAAAAPLVVGATALIFAVATLVPLVTNKDVAVEGGLGPFTEKAEMLNGRAAMLGFASLLVVEAIRQAPLFGGF